MRNAILILWVAAGASAGAGAQPVDLVATASFEEKGLIRVDEPLVLSLNRPLEPSEGHLRILVGDTDWTDLFDHSPGRLRFDPRVLALPPGETELTVYHVSASGEWTELTRLPLRVLARGELEIARIAPSLDLSLRAQVAQGHQPDFNAPMRETFQDLTLQAALETEHGSGAFRGRTAFQVLGTDEQTLALRFGELQEEAPKVDLAGYQVDVEQGPARFSLGDQSYGTHPLLMSAFGSRGGGVRLRLGRAADVSVASLYGTQVVGWGQFLGFTRDRHRLLGGTVGLELVPSRPSGLRLEASLLDGSVLNLTNFNQGVVNDVAESSGYGFRVVGSDPGQRLRVDANYARSRFTNPSDPDLEQGIDTVAVEEATRSARSVAASLDLVKERPVGETRTATVTLNLEHSRADPLYRSVGAAAVASDLLQNAVGVDAVLGEVSAQYRHDRIEDNLDDVASILKTFTRSHGASVSIPLASLASPLEPSPWLPAVSYAFARLHQFADVLPENGGFDPSHLPDQVSLNHNAGLAWQQGWLSATYNFNYSLQDNRQPGREEADLSTTVNALSFTVLSGPAIDLSLDLALERTNNMEIGRIDHFERVGFSLSWSPPGGFTLMALLNTSWNRDDTDLSSGRNVQADVQGSWRFQLRGEERSPSGTLFLRWATQRVRSRDFVFGIDDNLRAWQLQTGFTLSAF